MKKIGLIIMLTCLTFLGFGQKFAFVDTEYILNNIPSYKAAQDKINKLSDQWEKEVEGLFADVDKMYKDYQSEKVLLSEEMKKKREDDIMNKEKEAKDLQKKYFGPTGDLFKKRQELVKPIQDDVYKAVKELSVEGGFSVVFDSSAGANIIYSDPKYDKSDEILKKLGYKN